MTTSETAYGEITARRRDHLNASAAADADDAVRVVVVTGRGRAFCASRGKACTPGPEGAPAQ